MVALDYGAQLTVGLQKPWAALGASLTVLTHARFIVVAVLPVTFWMEGRAVAADILRIARGFVCAVVGGDLRAKKYRARARLNSAQNCALSLGFTGTSSEFHRP